MQKGTGGQRPKIYLCYTGLAPVAQCVPQGVAATAERGIFSRGSGMMDGQLRDNDWFLTAVADATALWRLRCREYLAEHGDVGSCVVGAGIMASESAPRAGRKRPRRQLIDAWAVSCGAQGSLVWEESQQEMVDYLRSRGIEAHYVIGSLD